MRKVWELLYYTSYTNIFSAGPLGMREMIMREFADDVVLMASTRQAAEAVIKTYANMTQ